MHKRTLRWPASCGRGLQGDASGGQPRAPGTKPGGGGPARTSANQEHSLCLIPPGASTCSQRIEGDQQGCHLQAPAGPGQACAHKRERGAHAAGVSQWAALVPVRRCHRALLPLPMHGKHRGGCQAAWRWRRRRLTVWRNHGRDFAVVRERSQGSQHNQATCRGRESGEEVAAAEWRRRWRGGGPAVVASAHVRGNRPRASSTHRQGSGPRRQRRRAGFWPW